MKHVQACLSAKEDREGSLHHCGGSVRLVLTRLCAGKTWQSRFNLQGGAVKHVEAFLSARKRSRKEFSPLWWHCEIGASLFMSGIDLIAQF